jgi:flagella basal body P-ring formation protein FlgA
MSYDNITIMYKTLKTLFFNLLFILVLITHTSASAFVKINLFESTDIESDKIILGEIGNISGDDDLQVEKVKNVVLGNAPLPGKNKKISRELVISRIKLSGIDLAKIQMISSDKVEIIRSSTTISPENIKKIVFSFLDKALPWDRENVNLKDIRVTNDIILPKGNITYKVVFPPNTDYVGLTPLTVYFYVNGNFEKRLLVTVNIEVMSNIVVTRKPLGRYKLITEEDVCLKKMNLAKFPSNVITRYEDVLGKRTRRTIDSNVALRPDLVELPPLIKRGDIVKIIVESEGLKVTTLGKAKEMGRRGEMIKVINVDSTKAIYARVIDSNSVKVDY